MSQGLDFQGLAQALLSEARTLLPEWLPGGRMRGHEYVVAGLGGGRGESCSVNTQKGAWADFSTGDKGGDLISLFAAIQGCSQKEAAVMLSENIRYQLRPAGYLPPAPKAAAAPEPKLGKPPKGVAFPVFIHPEHGEPTATWTYKDETDEPLFVVARYDLPDGKKAVSPWAWNLDRQKWVSKGLPEPRPLYGLELLPERPTLPILLVEGEKAADAARILVGDRCVVMTWPNGSSGYNKNKVNWGPIAARSVTIWPDADRHVVRDEREAKIHGLPVGTLIPYEKQPGIKAADGIAAILSELNCKVKIIDVGIDPDRKDGWDAADALVEGWDWDKWLAWAKPLGRVYGAKPMPPPAPAAPPADLAKPPVQVLMPKPKPPVVDLQDGEEAEVSASMFAQWDLLGIATNKAGHPFYNVDNALRVLEAKEEFKNVIFYDEFHSKLYTQFDVQAWVPLDKPREWRDVDQLNMTMFYQRHLGLHKMSDDIVGKALQIHAFNNIRNEPKEWLEKLTWDGVPRIEECLSQGFGCEQNVYTASASANWFKSMAARILKPGCKVDTMIILQGSQGKFKSTALSVLGGPWYTEVHESVTSKDFFMALQGKLIVEISELDAFGRAEVNTVKKIITTQHDRYRPPYGRNSVDFPRRSVFVGSTNEWYFLLDKTGARRFWPIKTGIIDVELLHKWREQLFAEAAALVKAGEAWHIMPAAATKKAQEEHRRYDEWEGLIHNYLDTQAEVSVHDVSKELGVPTMHFKQDVQRRITNILTLLGWECRQAWSEGKSVKLWRPGAMYKKQVV